MKRRTCVRETKPDSALTKFISFAGTGQNKPNPRQIVVFLTAIIIFTLMPIAESAQQQRDQYQPAEIRFKELAGPPTEFASMDQADPFLSAVRSKTALLPILLEDDGTGQYAWEAVLPLENDKTRILVIPDSSKSKNNVWKLTIPDTGALQSQSSRASISKGRLTEFSLGENKIPAVLYEVQRHGLLHQKMSIKSAAPGNGFLVIEGEKSIRLLSYRAAFNQRVGEKISVIAAIYDANEEFSGVGLEGVSEASLRITAPNGSEIEVPMLDDGSYQEDMPGDAVLVGEFLADQAGDFKVQVLLEGTTRTHGAFIRTAEFLIPIIEQSIHLQGNEAKSSLYGDHRLRIKLDVNVNGVITNRHYRVFAEIWGAHKQGAKASIPVAWVGGMATVEDHGIHIGLDTRWIEKAGAWEPFELRNVRIEDPDYAVSLSEMEKIPVVIPIFSRNTTSPDQIIVDEEMLNGPRPVDLEKPGLAATDSTLEAYQIGAGHRKLLVHGYCSSNVWGPETAEFDNESVFLDLGQNRTHDDFAQRILAFGSPWNSYSIIAHSQGGAAALHLLNFYWSGLDNAGSGRLIQTVGTPYQGTPLAGNLAVIGDIFGTGCGSNANLTTDGAATWLAGIGSVARSAVHYYTTSFEDGFWYDYCHLASDLFLDDPDDGVIEKSRGQLPNGNNQGHKSGWCHSSGMRDPAQTTDGARNAIMNGNAAISSIDLIVQSPAVSDSSLTPGEGFTANATVKNMGTSGSAGTTLRFYRSNDASITSADFELSTQVVGGLAPGATSPLSDPQLINNAGTYWIGACVDAVIAESDPDNNCSTGVQVVVQPCSYSITPTSTSVGHLGGTGSISLTASDPSCSWTAGETLSWVSGLSPTSGTGNDTVNYTVSQNTSSSSRSGSLTIAGQTFTVNQVGTDATVGPFTIVDFTVDDDSTGDSSGNGNGVAECGETIELYVMLQNQGSTAAQTVVANLSSEDSFFGGFLGNSSSDYPDIGAGATDANTDDFDFQLPADIPDGHKMYFDVNTTTFTSGPWNDSLAIDIFCIDVCDAPSSLTVSDETISNRQAFGACQNVSLGPNTEVQTGGQLIVLSEDTADLVEGVTFGSGGEVSVITGTYPETVCHVDPLCGAGGVFEVRHYPSGVCVPLTDCDLVWKCAEGPLTGTCNGGVSDCEVSPGCPDGVQTCSSGACTTVATCADLIKMEGYSWTPNYNQCNCADTTLSIGSCSP